MYVRARDIDDGLALEKAGAKAVVPETLEPSLQLGAAVLNEMEMSNEDISIAVDNFRRSHMGDLQMRANRSGSALGYGLPSNLKLKSYDVGEEGSVARTSITFDVLSVAHQHSADSEVYHRGVVSKFLSQIRNPLCKATTPPVRFSCATHLNPASRMISSSSTCLGNPTDSTRHDSSFILSCSSPIKESPQTSSLIKGTQRLASHAAIPYISFQGFSTLASFSAAGVSVTFRNPNTMVYKSTEPSSSGRFSAFPL